MLAHLEESRVWSPEPSSSAFLCQTTLLLFMLLLLLMLRNLRMSLDL